jgi:hypothetical protein
MTKRIDLVGQKFSRLTVISFDHTDKHGFAIWLCECECEKQTKSLVAGVSLRKGHTKSCGCLKEEISRIKSTKHGKSRSRLYNIYIDIYKRCCIPENKFYKDYGGRGIRICDEWSGENGLDNFYKWSMENGYTKELTIDRIDVNGNYEPKNCRWATRKEQQNNKRNTIYVTINGTTKAIADWAEESGIRRGIIYGRIKMGWKEDDLLKPSSRKII